MTKPCILLLAAVVQLGAETGHEAWLRYSPIKDPAALANYDTLPAIVRIENENSPVVLTARDELIHGIKRMLGRTLRISAGRTTEPEITLAVAKDLPAEGWSIRIRPQGIAVSGGSPAGVLYGAFALLRRMALHQPLANDAQSPYAPVRWINQWDNLDGTIERGYGGRSIFFADNDVRPDLGPVHDYARLLASLGINGCSINNVNANPRVITSEFLPQIARVAEAFRPWAVRLVLAVDFSSPRRIGGLDTFDPLDPRVAQWWKEKVDEIYRAIPDLGGIVLKADSEGRLGPSAYGRSHADAANVIARALKPHGGLIFYRGFVYDHKMDWRNLKNDRARAAFDNFIKLDGAFDDNVVIQIKHGPIDFQVREPASPLFGALEKTNQSVELQITQEYFGQARHLVYLVPMWKEALDFDMHAKGAGTPVKALVAGRVFADRTGGFVGVANVGLDANWLGHHLSQANLYGFGRLAWNPNLTSAEIAEEWTRLTFSHDPAVVDTITAMQTASWRNFENYTGPLGAQTLTEITGNHYGPAVEASERNGWGQWHRADAKGIGMDRTVATGTGFIGQYRTPVAKRYEDLRTCPDELLLFMHHVPYTHTLHSGKTVIQHIYDTHYEGAEAAGRYVQDWKSLEGKIDEQRYDEVRRKLEYQAGHAIVWRDAVNTWFLKTSGIPDRRKRAGTFPGRYEAEQMRLDGYTTIDVKPWEAASGSQAVECSRAGAACSASHEFQGPAGWYDLHIQYFDQNNGVSSFRVLVNDQTIEAWTAADTIPTARVDAHSSTRRWIHGVALRPGDTVRVEGKSDRGELAALDYIEIVRQTRPANRAIQK